VRLAGLSALLALASTDALFASEAAPLLVDAASDELPAVRRAALRGLIALAAAYSAQRRAAAEQRAAAAAAAANEDVSMSSSDGGNADDSTGDNDSDNADDDTHGDNDNDDACGAGGAVMVPAVEGTVTTLQQDSVCPEEQLAKEAREEGELSGEEEGEVLTTAVAAAAAGLAAAGAAAAPPAAAPPAAAPPAAAPPPVLPSSNRRGGRRAKRKRDVPPWAPDGLNAALSALRDADGDAVAHGLALAALLPPDSLQGALGELQALAACADSQGGAHATAARAVVVSLVAARGPLLASAAPGMARLLTLHLQQQQQQNNQEQQEEGRETKEQEQVGSVTSVVSDNVSNVCHDSHCAAGLDLLMHVAQLVAEHRPRAAAPLLSALTKAGVVDAPALAQLVISLRGAAAVAAAARAAAQAAAS
jgi:hypothetical protein